MFKEKGKVSIVNKILIAMLVVICVFTVVLIMLTQLNKKSVETHVKETQGMIQNYATNEKNTWDVSANGDGSVTATLLDDGTLTISGTGKMKDWVYTDTTDWHNSEIKEKVKNVVINREITSIGEDAFYGCSSLTNINIPSSVTNIGDFAFVGCSSLTEIKVDENNTKYIDHNGVLYTKDGKEIIKYPEEKEDTTYTILEGVTSIRNYAFHGCGSLTSITIPSSVTSIEDGAFRECISLTSINIPEVVTSIGDAAFYKCISLTKITLPKGIRRIGNNTFSECTSLTNIIIPEEVTKIGYGAFYKCMGLTSIIIPEGVTVLEQSTFAYCKGLSSINIPQGVAVIKEWVFEGCTNLTSIEIPSSVVSIGAYAFEDCTNIRSVKIADGLIIMEYQVFSGCYKLKEIVIPSSVARIGNQLLWNSDKCIIVCRSGSVAEKYAIENKIAYQTDDNGPTVIFSINGTDSPVKLIETIITVEDELAGVNKNSLKYLWSTENENITKEQIVNNFQNGETLNIKDVTGTYYLWIYAKDYLGNESIVRSEAFLIDNTPPMVETSYSTKQTTNQNVTVTITANEEIQALSGWTLSTDKKVLTKEYTANKTETVKIKDIVGNETAINIKITNIDKTAPTGQVSYSTTAKTNQNVRVTIMANEQVQALSGWTLSTDKKVLTKDYTANKTETITIKDIAGNETAVNISITNIDKTAPEAKIEYIQESNTKVKVRITTNEEIQALSGWTLSTDKKVLTKDYTANKTETIKIKDIAGNETAVEIKVTQVAKIFNVDTYEVKENYIVDINPKTTYENFIKNIETNSEFKVTEDGQNVTGKTLIKTGQKLTIGNETFTLVVTGDTNGDGQANIKDILSINKHRLNKAQLVNEYLQAGDINEDGKVNLRDILQINKYRLGKINQF